MSQHWACSSLNYRHILCPIVVLAINTLPSSDHGRLDITPVISIAPITRIQTGLIQQHWTPLYCHMRICLFLITIAVTLSSSHRDIEVAPVVNITSSFMSLSMADHEEMLEHRLSRLIVVAPVKFIRFASYVPCHLQIHEKYLVF